MKPVLDAFDRALVNRLQDGLPLVAEPFAAVADELGMTDVEVIARLTRLKSSGVLSRFGPMYNAAALGGGLTLCAMAVPQERFEDVAAIVNGFSECAHNYAREHHFNMWFVLATEDPARIGAVIADIERLTGIKVLNLPKLDEYFIGLKVDT